MHLKIAVKYPKNQANPASFRCNLRDALRYKILSNQYWERVTESCCCPTIEDIPGLVAKMESIATPGLTELVKKIKTNKTASFTRVK
jgi:hypothetical protein